MMDGKRDFVGAMYAYPWDIVDDGLDAALGRIHDLAGCGEVLLTPSYHVSNYFLPHNPRAPIRFGENGAVYFQPQFERYERTAIKPRVSPTVATDDHFERIVEGINRRGLVFSAWIVYFFNHHLTEQYPQYAKQDIFGATYFGQMSPTSEDAQEFAIALTREVMERFSPHAVRIEALQRQSWRHGMLKNKFQGDISERCQFLLGLCFNASSMRAAEAAGMDADAFRRELQAWTRTRLARIPRGEDLQPADAAWIGEAFGGRLRQYVDALNERTTDLWLRVAEVISREGGKVQSDLLADGARTDVNGLRPGVNRRIDRLTTGVSPDAADAAPRVRALLEGIAPGGELFVPVGPGNVVEPGPVIERVQAAKGSGAAGALFYNYGLMREEQLRFVGEAMRSV